MCNVSKIVFKSFWVLMHKIRNVHHTYIISLNRKRNILRSYNYGLIASAMNFTRFEAPCTRSGTMDLI